jgi:putative membrane protein
MMMYGWGNGEPMWWGGMIVGPIMMILFLVVAVLAVAWALRATGLGWSLDRREQTPLDILKSRFARGEIDRAEYEERRKLLNGS